MLALAVGVNCLSLWFKKEQMGFSGLQCFVVLWGSFSYCGVSQILEKPVAAAWQRCLWNT